MFLFRWLLKNMEGYRRKYIAALFMTIITSILLTISPFVMQIVIDKFITGENAAENLTSNSGELYLLIGLTILISLTRSAIRYAMDMVFEKCSQGVVYKIRSHLFKNMQSQDSDFYDLYRTGDIMTRLSGDVEMVRHTTSWSFKTLIDSVVTFIAVSVFYFTINPYMALCMIATTPLILIITLMYDKKAGIFYSNLREQAGSLNTGAQENISGNKVVRAFAAENFEISRFKKLNKAYSDRSKATSINWWKYFLPIETSSQAVTVVHIIIGGIFCINGILTLGEYTAFSMLSWALSMPMSTLGYVISDLKQFSASATKIVEVYYSKARIVDRSDSIPITERLKGDIEFKNVSFSYADKKEGAVLTDINLSIKAGETVAIMGETGSGKTSLINLIPRLYDTTTGEVLIDNINVRNLKLKDLRSSIGIAMQEVLLFSDTIENNICFGCKDLSHSEIECYAKKAQAHNFIKKTVDGYETVVGERGVGLSGGQKQRISLARALAMRPSVLILDDTTSAVDSETEKAIAQNLLTLDFKCTKIIVCARTSSARNADKIIVLKKGKIVEMGTHDDLIKKDGYYSEVHKLQS